MQEASAHEKDCGRKALKIILGDPVHDFKPLLSDCTDGYRLALAIKKYLGQFRANVTFVNNLWDFYSAKEKNERLHVKLHKYHNALKKANVEDVERIKDMRSRQT